MEEVQENGKYIIPEWCRNKCVNSGSIACEHECAAVRDARYFVAHPHLTLQDIAPFPSFDWSWNSSPQERQAIAGLYLAKMVEALTGTAENGHNARRLELLLTGASSEAGWKLLAEMAVNNNEEGK